MSRWVMLLIPEPFEYPILGREPLTVYEAPRGVGREVRLATEAETGLFTRKALPRGTGS